MQYKAGLTSALLFVAALAADSSSNSDSTPCSISGTATASAQADLDKYASCKKLSGNLHITGDDVESLALANVEEIDGDLVIENAPKIVRFAADNLKKITGRLDMSRLTVLQVASFGSLESISDIRFVTLPAATQIITSKLKTAKNILVSDTSLESIKDFSSLQDVEKFDVNNNKNLLTIDSSIQHVRNSLSLSSNGRETSMIFNNLVWANNITLFAVKDFSFKALQTVNYSMAIHESPLAKIELSNLTTVGGDLTFANNTNLQKVDVSKLTKIQGALSIEGNSALDRVDGFSSVENIDGSLTVKGSFSSLDLKSLKVIKGNVLVDTKASNFSCDPLRKLKDDGTIRGQFQCSAAKNSRSKSDSSSDSSSGSGSSSSDSDSNGSPSSNVGSAKPSDSGAGRQIIPAASFMGAAAAVAIALL